MTLILKGGSGTTSIEGETDGAKIDATGALTIPVGTTAQRPGTPATGMLRLNTDNNDVVEVYNGTAWVTVGKQTDFFSADLLVIAGGGGGGSTETGGGAGGGGAGGYRELAAQTIDLGIAFTVTVGGGGAGAFNVVGTSGTNSVFGTTTSAGGGGGGGGTAIPSGLNGGSGGGGRNNNAAGAGNTPVTSPSQGNNGGAGGPNSGNFVGGGGGGAGSTGVAGTSTVGGNGER